MIIDEIKKDNVQAMKDHDSVARAIFGVVMNKVMLLSIELKKDGKELVDADTVQILQKTIKELNEERDNYIKAGNEEQAQIIERQKAIVEKYLPKMMSEEEIKAIIDAMEDKSIPAIMKKFKSEYAGKVDMGMVNRIARS